MPTSDELMKAFESMSERAAPRIAPPGGTPTANALARRFMELEQAAGTTAEEVAPAASKIPLTQRSGLMARTLQWLTRGRVPAATANAVEATKAAATEAVAGEGAATAATADWLAAKTGGWVTNKLAFPRPVRTLALAEAGKAALGLGLTAAAQHTLTDAQDPAIRLLRKYGMETERGTPETSANLGISDTYGWYSGSSYLHPIDTVKRALSGEGDPNWTDPRSDINQLRVYTPEGEEITGGMGNDLARAQMMRQADLFRAAGLMDNKIRAQRGLPPVYSPAELLRNRKK
jgi:hypothetical protein